MINKKRVFVACPPLSKFCKPPADQPGCIESRCPDCNESMWISKKKQIIKKIALPEELYMVCYECFTKKAETDPVFFHGFKGHHHI